MRYLLVQFCLCLSLGFTADAKKHSEVLLLGDELFEHITHEGNIHEKTLIAAERIDDLHSCLEDLEYDRAKPDILLLHIGVADLEDSDAESIVVGIDKILAQLRKLFPKSRIGLIRLNPDRLLHDIQQERLEKVNELLKLLTDPHFITLCELNTNRDDIESSILNIIENLKSKGALEDFRKYADQEALFVEPNTHGSCDPEIVYNSWDKHYYIYYTTRRPHMQNTFLGTPLGVIRSPDLMEWEFLGYCNLGEPNNSPYARSTYWAPAIIKHDGRLHMFVTWKPDLLPIKGAWGGQGFIVHYSAPMDDPVQGWLRHGLMHDSNMDTIDASIFKNEEGFHLWFKGKPLGGGKNELYYMRSKDLKSWETHGFSQSDVFNKSVTGSGFEEAPYVFFWQDKYWLITDPHLGLFVYWSEDGNYWNFQGTILREGGNRLLDGNMARHCSVAVIEDRAFIFYHVEPWRVYESGIRIFNQSLYNRRSVLQMAELKIDDDGNLYCDRDAPLMLSK